MFSCGLTSRVWALMVFARHMTCRAHSFCRMLRLSELPSLTCSVCTDDYQDTGTRIPKLLPCSHTVCLGCLGSMVQGGQVTCPECRARHVVPSGQPEGFNTNRYVLDLRRIVNRVAQQVRRTQDQVQGVDPGVSPGVDPGVDPGGRSRGGSTGGSRGRSRGRFRDGSQACGSRCRSRKKPKG